MVHVKDFRRTDGRRETVVIGEGAVDWAAVLGALSDIDYDGYLTLEVPGTAETADDIAVRSREALRQLKPDL
jgi:hexulose-6-phosphate isomerase